MMSGIIIGGISKSFNRRRQEDLGKKMIQIHRCHPNTNGKSSKSELIRTCLSAEKRKLGYQKDSHTKGIHLHHRNIKTGHPLREKHPSDVRRQRSDSVANAATTPCDGETPNDTLTSWKNGVSKGR